LKLSLDLIAITLKVEDIQYNTSDFIVIAPDLLSNRKFTAMDQQHQQQRKKRERTEQKSID